MKISKTAAASSRRSRDVASPARPTGPQGRSGRAASRAEQPGARRIGSRDASGKAPVTAPVARTPVAEGPAAKNAGSRGDSVAVTRECPAQKRVGFVCAPCGRFIPTEVDGFVLRARTGSAQRFCSPGCRQAAYRRRRAGVGEDTPLQFAGGRGRSLNPSRGKTNA